MKLDFANLRLYLVPATNQSVYGGTGMKLKPYLIIVTLVYLIVCSGMILATPAAQAAPEALIPEKEYKFDIVPDGTEVTHVFKVQNKGTETLDILKVRTG